MRPYISRFPAKTPRPNDWAGVCIGRMPFGTVGIFLEIWVGNFGIVIGTGHCS
jgi:hypothetical protein